MSHRRHGSRGVSGINRRSRIGASPGQHRTETLDRGTRVVAGAVGRRWWSIVGTADWGVGASGSALVFVDDAAEDIATDDLAATGDRGRPSGDRLVEIETAMGPGFVVMADILGEQGLEMSL